MEIVAKTFYGFEEVLAEEIRKLGGKKVTPGNRVVNYEGDREILYLSNVWLRTAISILVPINTFTFSNERDLVKKLGDINYSGYFSVNKTFAVKGAVNSTLFKHSQFPQLLLKDAIADHFRDNFGKRPNVDKLKPQVVFDLHIKENECTVSLNSSGAPLFQRGYRSKVGIAPLNEAVAAGLILMSGWDQKSDFYDPFCGSGTLAIEAALIANELPPSLERSQFSFKYWKDFDQTLWDKIEKEIPRKPKKDLKIKVIGSDTDTDMVQIARNNARALPIENILKFEAKDFKDQKPSVEEGVLITNPPYGERLEIEDISALYKEIGDFFKKNMTGFDCWVISSNEDAFKNIELKPSKKIKVYNGALECDFKMYKIFKGSYLENKFGKERLTEPRGRKIKRD